MNPEKNLDIKNVVVALDMSEYSKTVLKQARVLAKKFGAPLSVIYVAEEAVPFAPLVPTGFNYIPPTEAEMLPELRSFYGFPEAVNVCAKTGAVAENVVHFADTTEKSLLIIGATRGSGLARFVLGSEAEKIALQAKCPVWVHRGRRLRHFRYALMPVDFSEITQRAVEFLKSPAKALALNLNYLYVRPQMAPLLDYKNYIQSEKELQRHVRNLVKEFKNKNKGGKIKVAAGNAPEEILSRAKNYDFIVMCPHNRSGIFHRLGRVTSKILRLSPVPVLIIKPSPLRSAK